MNFQCLLFSKAFLFLLLVCFFSCAAKAAPPKPVFLYCRYFNAEGETRYLADGNYKGVVGRLSGDYDVRVQSKPLTDQNLSDVKVLLTSTPATRPWARIPRPIILTRAT
jgi:hypothetical protein